MDKRATSDNPLRRRHTNKSIVGNLWRLVKDAKPTEHESYLQWYEEAELFIVGLGMKHKTTSDRVAAACAALSPQKSWSQNKKLLVDLLEKREVKHITAFVEMAKNALEIGFAALSGQKIISFALNLLGDRDTVTVDRIVCRAASIIDKHGNPKNSPTALEFVQVGECVRKVTELYNSKYRTEYKPAEIQALIWCLTRGKGD